MICGTQKRPLPELCEVPDHAFRPCCGSHPPFQITWHCCSSDPASWRPHLNIEKIEFSGTTTYTIAIFSIQQQNHQQGPLLQGELSSFPLKLRNVIQGHSCFYAAA
jgi:hypothetical protein